MGDVLYNQFQNTKQILRWWKMYLLV